MLFRMFFRPATDSDAQLIADLVNEQEWHIDPKAVEFSLVEAHELVQGWFDESETGVIHASETEPAVGAFSLQVDRARGRVYCDIYLKPGIAAHSQVLAEVQRRNASYGLPLWLGVNAKNESLRNALIAAEGSHLASTWLMARPLADDAMPAFPEGVRIRRAESDADRRMCHEIYEDSFANHFGFVPRSFEEWIEPLERSLTKDPQGMALLEVDGVAEGFVECDRGLAHDGSGHVGLLGVRHRAHKRGFGRLLLQWAFAHSAEQGFSRIELSVDTGNQSGALALYESLGFAAVGGWETWLAPAQPEGAH